jgi:hypothetical protein
VLDDPEELNAITVIGEEVSRTFNQDVTCVLGPDDSGSIAGTAADGSTMSFTLDGTASRVVIEGEGLNVDAAPASVSNDQAILTVTVESPPTTILVALAFCTEG